MKKLRNWIIVVLLLAVAGAAYWFFAVRGTEDTAETYQTEPAARGRLSASVGATGTVRANQTALLNWQTTGMVELVTVKVGDTVEKDQVLASLDETTLPQNVILAQADLVAAQRALDDLLVSTLPRAQAYQAFVTAQKALEDAQTKVDALDLPRASDTKVENLEAEIDLANQRLTLAKQAYDTVKRREDGDPLKAQALANLTSTQLYVDQLQAELNWLTGVPTDLDAAQMRAALEVASAQLAEAQRELDRLQDGVDPNDVLAAKARITAIQATLNFKRIAAPFGGTITQAAPKIGDVVSPGIAAFRLDDLDHLLVDVQVSEVDINSVAIGQNVLLSFDAILGEEYNGKVVEVGQVGNSAQGVVNFVVTVELTDADELVKPGMTAAVSVLVKELNDVLLVPNRAVRLSEGQRVVYVLRAGVPEMVEITLGASSDAYSEVIAGDLEEGDLIILNPPSVFGGPGGGMFGPGGN